MVKLILHIFMNRKQVLFKSFNNLGLCSPRVVSAVSCMTPSFCIHDTVLIGEYQFSGEVHYDLAEQTLPIGNFFLGPIVNYVRLPEAATVYVSIYYITQQIWIGSNSAAARYAAGSCFKSCRYCPSSISNFFYIFLLSIWASQCLLFVLLFVCLFVCLLF